MRAARQMGHRLSSTTAQVLHSKGKHLSYTINHRNRCKFTCWLCFMDASFGISMMWRARAPCGMIGKILSYIGNICHISHVAMRPRPANRLHADGSAQRAARGCAPRGLRALGAQKGPSGCRLNTGSRWAHARSRCLAYFLRALNKSSSTGPRCSTPMRLMKILCSSSST